MLRRRPPPLPRALGLLPRRNLAGLAIQPDRFNGYGVTNELGSGLCAATVAREREEKASYMWDSVREEAEKMLSSSHRRTQYLRQVLQARVLPHNTIAEAVNGTLSKKLAQQGGSGLDEESWGALLKDIMDDDPEIEYAAACDLARYVEIDPAADGHLSVFLFFKGFQAVQCARVSNFLWKEQDAESRLLARMLQCRGSHTWGVDIHPGAKLGRGVTLDHATGIVIGETAEVGNNVGFMHDVTLGATGKSVEHDRHPKVRDGAFLSAKCTVLGNIEVGEEAIVAANALVNKPVPPRHTALGVPAKMIPMTGSNHLPISDPMVRWAEKNTKTYRADDGSIRILRRLYHGS